MTKQKTIKFKRLVERKFKRKILGQEIEFFAENCFVGWDFDMGEMIGPIVEDMSDDEIVSIFKEQIKWSLVALAREILKNDKTK